ncbi:hypothetical protein LOC68_01020 [Blastopirellula sp. JC732]|uniref:Uncharacterized protein n=1 Tax=Blastopirellula sediminis TaxID=2894196 RepID=A0A9X1MIQ5_9BACT|nr:hypothetical protein [Blastopirellula sediminis]MCC9608232.1 hypothetical protein [Blastopirellula sediminis]MCC9626975.1 hypothetical protein [Blastopirellula sediminis]
MKTSVRVGGLAADRPPYLGGNLHKNRQPGRSPRVQAIGDLAYSATKLAKFG